MNLAVWAGRNGVARVTAYRWLRAGQLPVKARKVWAPDSRRRARQRGVPARADGGVCASVVG